MPEPRHILVTGASGVVGTAVVRALLRRDHAVVATHQRAETAHLIPEAPGVSIVRADLSTPGGVAALLETLDRRELAISALVHAAAVVDTTPPAELDGARFAKVLALNVSAAHELTYGLHRRGGLEAVVLLSSIAAEFPHLGSVAYVTSKGAVDALTRALAQAFAPTRVNAVAPGIVASARTAADAAFVDADLVDADGVGDVVAFLVGSDSRAATGQILRVDGGRTLRLS